MDTGEGSRLTPRRLESVLLGLLAGLAALAVWAVAAGFGAGASAGGLPIVALGTTQASVSADSARSDSTATSGATSTTGPDQASTGGPGAATTSLPTTSTSTQQAPGQTGGGRTVITQRLRTDAPGAGQDTGNGGPRYGQGR